MEALQGTFREPDPTLAASKLSSITGNMPGLPVTVAIAERCAYLREALHSEERRVNSRAIDLLIAATAIEHDLMLVTRNVRD